MSSTTGIDINVLLNTILGGIITISGSLAVAWLYIRNQNKVQRRRLLQELVQETYFDQGLFPVFAALSEYGMSTVFALADSRRYLERYQEHHDPALLQDNLKEITKRPMLLDLTSHTFTNVLKFFPTVHKFGSSVYSSIIRTLQFYSSIADDGVTFDGLNRSIKQSSVEEVVRSLGAIAQIIDTSLTYLEKRLINLRDYFLQQELDNYADFSKVFLDKNYQNFLSMMDEYKNGITKLIDAMVSANSEERKNATLSFSKWLNENLERNPLMQEEDPVKTFSSKESPQ